MITNLILTIIVAVFNTIMELIPSASIATIPLIGETVSAFLLTMIQTWNTFLITFPYAQTGWDVFRFVILPFELTLLVVNFFLGSRKLGNN